tara:strand:+ start:700 stop:1290 length:591 start_codon:yes stop_codon:yes gene_type:complete
MTSQNIIIYDFKELFSILEEIKEILKFNLIFVNNTNKELSLDKSKYGNFLILAKKNNNIKKISPNINENRIIEIENYPIKMEKLIEILNVNLLKQEYNFKSEIKLEKYLIDLNSREISNSSKSLRLTEKEINIILFLKSKKKPQKIEVLQKEVWGYVSELETHTVETHVYRLRKKIKDIFNDENFLISQKSGYTIN